MKTVLALALVLGSTAAATLVSTAASANPLVPPKPGSTLVCQSNYFVPTQLPDGTWRCLPRYH